MRAFVIFLVLLIAFSASAEGPDPAPAVPCLPQDAVFLDGAQQDDLYVEHYSCREELLTLIKKDRQPVRLFSEAPAFFNNKQDLALARSAVKELFQDALIVSEIKPRKAEEGYTPFTVFILSERYAGSLSIAENRIVSRDITFDQYISDGLLTYEGAKAAIGFHRPEAVLLEIEFEKEDRIFIYEGEVMLNGKEYEFEISASNGRLLEWERD